MSLGVNWELKVDNSVYKKLKTFPKKDVFKIVQEIGLFTQNPYKGDIKRIKKEEFLWRRRIGDYRIFYEIHQSEKIINVLYVERRTSRTY